MELLPLSKVKDIKAQEQARDILRTQEVKDALNKANKEFAKAQADFNSMLARNLAQWSQEEEKHVSRVTEMTNEIILLDSQKKDAMKPIDELMAKAHEELKKAMEIIVKNESWSETLSDTQEILEEKLSEAEEREIDVSRRENKVLIKEEGVEMQAQIVQRGIQALEHAQQEFYLYKLSEEKIIENRKIELRKEEINIEARETKIQRDIAAINRSLSQIEDARGVIAREYARLNIPV